MEATKSPSYAFQHVLIEFLVFVLSSNLCYRRVIPHVREFAAALGKKEKSFKTVQKFFNGHVTSGLKSAGNLSQSATASFWKEIRFQQKIVLNLTCFCHYDEQRRGGRHKKSNLSFHDIVTMSEHQLMTIHELRSALIVENCSSRKKDQTIIIIRAIAMEDKQEN